MKATGVLCPDDIIVSFCADYCPTRLNMTLSKRKKNWLTSACPANYVRKIEKGAFSCLPPLISC